jgi:hypothetical protein
VAALPPTKSEVPTPTARTIVREMWVSSIRETNADPSMFLIPQSYRRADVKDVPKSATETLTFDPPAQ